MAAGDLIIGRGVRVEVATAYGTAQAVSAVSKADPAVATTGSAHGLAAKSVAYLRNVVGMENLDGQAVRFGAVPTTTTLTLTDIDSTAFGDFVSGELVPVTTWATLAKSTSFTEGGGEGEKLNVTTLLDNLRKERNGLLAAETVTLNLLAETVAATAMAFIRKAARTSTPCVFRVTWNNGDTLVFRGEPSKPGRDVQQGQAGTGSLSITVIGVIVEGLA